MLEQVSVAAVAAVVFVSPLFAQAKKGANSIAYDVTVTAEGTPYTGTMTLAVAGGKVSGTMHITKPSEITGTPEGTVKGSNMNLDFAYRMVERGCDGRIVMAITLPQKKDAGPATGTVGITGCGRPEGSVLPGTIELKPQAAATK